MGIFQDIKTLRWITLAVSFLFVPASYLGMASVWSVGFASLLSLFFRNRLVEINKQGDHFGKERQLAKYTSANLVTLYFESYFILACSQLLAFAFGYKNIFVHEATGFDLDLYKRVARLFFLDFDFSFSSAEQQLIIVIYIFSLFFLFGLCTVSLRSYLRTIKRTYSLKLVSREYAAASQNTDIHLKYAKQYICFGILSTLSVLSAVAIGIFTYEFVSHMCCDTVPEYYSEGAMKVFMLIIPIWPFITSYMICSFLIMTDFSFGVLKK